MMNTDEKKVSDLLYEIGAYGPHRNAVARMITPIRGEQLVNDYVRTCQGKNHKFRLQIIQVFQIDHPRDQSFDTSIGNNVLLWHGTRTDNVYTILRDGYRAAFASNSAMFGPGIYFTNCVTKAAGYCSEDPRKFTGGADDGNVRPRVRCGYLFCSQVALGRPKTDVDEDGDDFSVPEGPLKLVEKCKLQYDEFVVYRSTQVKHEYLVKVAILPK
ncbi:Poly [ADP-ribose] polymerase [Aphelenchoides fujianensis]|nr:Poly [ADP-ribose] polymerase [Aphelenchoides fujianensis]